MTIDSKSTITIRKASQRDVDDISKILTRSLKEICARDYDADALNLWCFLRSPEHVIHWIEASDSLFIVAEDRPNKPIGAALFLEPNKIKLCHVFPERIGRGVGRILMAALEHHALKRGVASVELSSTITAEGFYSHLGYHSCGEGLALGKIRFIRMAKVFHKS